VVESEPVGRAADARKIAWLLIGGDEISEQWRIMGQQLRIRESAIPVGIE
jgi:hypothetical protein